MIHCGNLAEAEIKTTVSCAHCVTSAHRSTSRDREHRSLQCDLSVWTALLPDIMRRAVKELSKEQRFEAAAAAAVGYARCSIMMLRAIRDWLCASLKTELGSLLQC